LRKGDVPVGIEFFTGEEAKGVETPERRGEHHA
jgi:hypothetical protein